ncbi:DUF4214 domain-containing protein [Bradyrhizobium sp. HKCCYLS20291]|uniref:DUF4214 domain-containing protein n=1 Tax=Bradyrhizobium sp. HKCCYLS20291 TaxID=3420766 RepID=UPI003EB75897
MLRGHIDGLTSSGWVEGWAFDDASPLSVRAVSVFDSGGTEHATGFAHRYRPDLVAGKLGTGWHGFRLRLKSAANLRRATLVLVDRQARRQLHVVEKPSVVSDGAAAISSVDVLLKTDPTMIGGIDELAGCEGVFNAVIGKRGVDGFVKLAYVYVLGRAADPTGISLYGKKLRRGEISPFALLKILSDSDEFRSRPRLLTSPVAPGFPFA